MSPSESSADFKKYLLYVWDLLLLGLLFTLADVGVLTLILTPVAVFAVYGLRIPLERSFSGQAFWAFWNLWKRAVLGPVPHRILVIGATFFGSIAFWASIRRHAAFESHAFDLGIFTNAIWNLTHQGKLYSAVKGGMPLLADHQSPLILVFAPLFYLFSSPITLLALQAYGLALGAIPLFWIGRQFTEDFSKTRDPNSTKSWIPAVLPWIYWAYLPIRYAAQFDFHTEVFILPLFLAAIACFQSESDSNRFWGMGFLVLGLMGKESAGPLAVGVGVAWLLGAGPLRTRLFTRAAALGWISLGLLVFYADIRVIPTLMGARGYAYTNLYSQYGSSFLEILEAPIVKADVIVGQLFAESRWVFLFWTLAPLGFLPLLNLSTIIATLPAYLMLFLSAGDHRVDVHWHYGIEPAVGLFFSLPAVYLKLNQSKLSRFLPLYVVFAVMATFTKSEIYKGWQYQPNAHMQWLTTRFLPLVDSGVSLAATESLVPHLSTRHWVERLDYLRVPTVEQPSCAIYDESLSNWPMEEGDRQEILKLLESPTWQSVYHCGSVHVWARGGYRCMVEFPICDNR